MGRVWLRQQRCTKIHKIREGTLYCEWPCVAKVLGSGPIDPGSILLSDYFPSHTLVAYQPSPPASVALMAYCGGHCPVAAMPCVV